MLWKLSLVVVAFAMSACIRIRDPKKEGQDSQNAPPPVPEISYEIEPLPQPNRYLVKFKGLSPEALVQRNTSNEKGQVQVQALTSSEDVTEKGGIYEYRVQVQGQERRVQVQIPFDLVIEGTKKISDLEMNIEDLPENKWGLNKRLQVEGRLYFKANSLLVTEGQNLLLEAQSIYSEGARLESFLDTELSVINKNGSSGGLVYMKAKQLKGLLAVTMKGQTGIASLFHPGGRREGFNGGNSGQLFVDIQDLSQGSIAYQAQPGPAGQAAIEWTACFETREQCKRRPRPQPAASGQPGLSQPACLLRNGKCEELKAYN